MSSLPSSIVSCLIAYSLFVVDLFSTLNDSYLESIGVKMLPGWSDPWGERSVDESTHGMGDSVE